MIRRFTICACAALAILTGRTDAMAARQKGGPVETGPGTAAAARKFLEGRWSLVSFEVLPPGQAPLRVNGSGTLVYDAFGQSRCRDPRGRGNRQRARPRYWQVADNILTLTTRGDDGQPLSVARWQKSTAHAP